MEVMAALPHPRLGHRGSFPSGGMTLIHFPRAAILRACFFEEQIDVRFPWRWDYWA